MNKRSCGEMLPLDLGFPVSRIKGTFGFYLSAYSSSTSNREDFGKGCMWLPGHHAV